MSPIASVLVVAGSALALVGGVGLLRLRTPFARFHAAGKASPVGFLLIAVGASLETGLGGAARLAVAAVALVLTLPVGVHLLFRAVHRTTPTTLEIDELAPAEGRLSSKGSPPVP